MWKLLGSTVVTGAALVGGGITVVDTIELIVAGNGAITGVDTVGIPIAVEFVSPICHINDKNNQKYWDKNHLSK